MHLFSGTLDYFGGPSVPAPALSAGECLIQQHRDVVHVSGVGLHQLVGDPGEETVHRGSGKTARMLQKSM